MSISSVNLSLNTLGAAAGKAQSELDPQTSLSTVRDNENSAVAQLSGIGRVRASLDDLQHKAQALKNLSKPPTFGDFQVVVQGFVQSFNALNSNAGPLASKQGVLGTESRFSQALGSVRQTAADADQSGVSSLQKIGISQQASGAFSINQKQLSKSFKDDQKGALSAIFDLADRVTRAAGKQTTVSGIIGKEEDNLSARAKKNENTHVTAQDNIDTRRKSPLATAVLAPGGYPANNAVAAYSSVASL